MKNEDSRFSVLGSFCAKGPRKPRFLPVRFIVADFLKVESKQPLEDETTVKLESAEQ